MLKFDYCCDLGLILFLKMTFLAKVTFEKSFNFGIFKALYNVDCYY